MMLMAIDFFEVQPRDDCLRKGVRRVVLTVPSVLCVEVNRNRVVPFRDGHE